VVRQAQGERFLINLYCSSYFFGFQLVTNIGMIESFEQSNHIKQNKPREGLVGSTVTKGKALSNPYRVSG
jgi:hypothetical protein